MRALRTMVLPAALLLGACSFGPSPPPPATGASGAAPGVSSGAAATPSLADALHACPVTAPNQSTPPGVSGRMFFGRNGLWTLVWPHGFVLVPPDDVRSDGALGMKFPWWRGPGVRGSLDITGEEIASRSPVQARTSGYGLTGFNASMIYFPSEGCYRVTGTADGASITFVTLVRTCSSLSQLPLRERRQYRSWCSRT